MSTEFSNYKQNKVNVLTNTYNTQVNLLYSVLNTNIRNIQNSNISASAKITQINIAIKQYNTSIAMLKTKLNADILAVNMSTPNIPDITNIQNQKALLIGINYTGSSYQLSGCINDANNINTFLAPYGFKTIKMLTDNVSIKPTRANILNEFTNLLANSKAGDVLFFSYSGHGSQIKDTNNNETTGNDQMIIPSDFKYIVDDDLKQIIQNNLNKDATLIALFDSCYSGSVLDLKYNYMDSLNKNTYTENAKESDTLGNVIMISGCSDVQTSADAVINNINQGAMTWAFLKAFQDKNITWRQLLLNMRSFLKSSKLTQTPQLTSGQFMNIDSKVFI